MNNNLVNSLLAVCKILHKHSVQYIIVGGAAVALHGYFRYSTNMQGLHADKPDLDFWYNPTYANYFKLLDALEELGQDVKEFKEEQTPNPRKSFFKFELEDFTLDFLPELKSSLQFTSSYKKREVVSLFDNDIFFINYEDLLLDKQASSRYKDKEDIEQLKKNKESGE